MQAIFGSGTRFPPVTFKGRRAVGKWLESEFSLKIQKCIMDQRFLMSNLFRSFLALGIKTSRSYQRISRKYFEEMNLITTDFLGG